ncbi:phosphatase PAP2 family protein [Terriglobus roseus]|uniref:PAP2 superfamily protein n=1 Tax=Terriglobus roseus TaxID=392734 RepID=A0A1G7MQ10_9BACT|nr:phosphatase PAP2 family protein [Terriglobus roseus]SDF63761.1 PAP2 superfamily protein [Terriglobus roseus]
MLNRPYRIATGLFRFVAIASLSIACVSAIAQSPNDTALRGLSPVTTLYKTANGQAALSANLTVTGGIQTGAIPQPTLLPAEEQRQLALRDAAITSANAAQLADALGTALGSAYVARAHYIDRSHFTVASESVTQVLNVALSTSGTHSAIAKFFFANGTTDGKTAATGPAADAMHAANGVTDPFGRAYHLPAGSPNADTYGNSRPFQTEPEFRRIVGRDYFNLVTDNTVYTRGPVMDLINSPSYPSGHTTYGYTASLVLGLLVPDRYPQMIARGAEYGNSRIIVGAHYAMDVLGGRTLALHDMAHLLANDPAYLKSSKVSDFRAAVTQARTDLGHVLESACGKTVAECATEDTSRYSDASAVSAFYAVTQTYGLPVVYPETATKVEDVGKIAPEAGYLLTAAYPSLTLAEADQILTETEGPGGGFLDDGSAFGLYSRINLYEAAVRAASLTKSRAGTK